MDFLTTFIFPFARFLLLALLGVLVSCAKVSYLVEQGMGQMNLQYNSVPNQKILEDPKISSEVKEKIKKIETYKNFFYDYFQRPSTGIYSETVMLDSEAVTYLVVASPHDEIRSLEHCFLFMGCFPYLGFFEEDSAKEFQKDLEAQEYVTWRRPVYAYSTLGYLEDRILSSFFHFDDFKLAELIFHELFHTIFFVKNEVDLNENLANYFGQELALEYFQFDELRRHDFITSRKHEQVLSREVVQLAQNLQSQYKQSKGGQEALAKEKSQQILQNFLKHEFIPQIERKCRELNISPRDCGPLKREWNNASFSAFLTYEDKEEMVEKLRAKLGGGLKVFYSHLEKKYQEYRDSVPKSTFEEVLFESL